MIIVLLCICAITLLFMYRFIRIKLRLKIIHKYLVLCNKRHLYIKYNHGECHICLNKELYKEIAGD